MQSTGFFQLPVPINPEMKSLASVFISIASFFSEADFLGSSHHSADLTLHRWGLQIVLNFSIQMYWFCLRRSFENSRGPCHVFVRLSFPAERRAGGRLTSV